MFCGTSTLSTSPLHSSFASFINGAPEGWRRLTQRRMNGAYFCGSFRKSCASCGERMISFTRVGAKLRRMARCAARNGFSSTSISEEKKTAISSPALLAVTRSRVKCPFSSCAAPSSRPSHCCATVRHQLLQSASLRDCQAQTEHFRKQISKHFWIWGFAPSPHQRAFRSPFGNLRAQILHFFLKYWRC